ncbi:MAG: terminase small subunit [Clostridiales bacterium]|nr:terminase small subunit [Clostridiales bacterium]
MARRKKITKKEVCDGLRRLAFGEITDAVSLLFKDEQSILQTLPTLNLFNVSEIKRPKGGGMEIKFFDRFKALDKLMELAQETETKHPSFFEALEKSAANTAVGYGDDEDV